MTITIPDDPQIPHLRAQLPQGQLFMTRIDGPEGRRVRIDHADPRIIIGVQLIDDIVCGRCIPDVTISHPQDATATSWFGAVIRVEAVNRTLVYRLTEYVPWYCGWIAEWPD